MPRDSSAYLPIADYGVIGNLRSVALVGRNGSIDWCCFPHMAAPSVFARLLDARMGGHFRVALASRALVEQYYLEDTNVLCTHWRDDRGALRVTDFMPLSGRLDGSEPPTTQPEIHRLLRCESGIAEVEVEWAPRLDYGRAFTHVEPVPGGFSATAGALQLGLAGLPPDTALGGDMSGPWVRAAGPRRPPGQGSAPAALCRSCTGCMVSRTCQSGSYQAWRVTEARVPCAWATARPSSASTTSMASWSPPATSLSGPECGLARR